MFQLIHLFILVVTNSLVLFALAILLGRTLWSVALNITMIEGWEIERHETLLRRARHFGGYLDAPDGSRMPIKHQEFPWDIGVWNNVCQAFGSRNPLAWLWPFCRSLNIESGLFFKHNEIEGNVRGSYAQPLDADPCLDPTVPWPPPDPDRMYRAPRNDSSSNAFTQSMDIEDFRRRQQADLARYTDNDGDYVVRRKPFHERVEAMNAGKPANADANSDAVDDAEGSSSDSEAALSEDNAGEEAWRNKEGERLDDFGVDEAIDFYDEDDMPLAELIRMRKAGEE